MPNRPVIAMGSSIFAQWFNIQDLLPYDSTLNLAVGGTTTLDWVDWIDNRILPHNPKAILFYAGGNDLDRQCPVTDIVDRSCKILMQIHEQIPDCMAYYFSIIRAPQKQPIWNPLDELNKTMKDFTTKHPWLKFIDLNPMFYDEQQNIKAELFIEDRVHLTTAAYNQMVEHSYPLINQTS